MNRGVRGYNGSDSSNCHTGRGSIYSWHLHSNSVTGITYTLRGARRAPVGGVHVSEPSGPGRVGELLRFPSWVSGSKYPKLTYIKLSPKDNNTHSLRLLLLSAGIPAPCLPSRAPPLPV